MTKTPTTIGAYKTSDGKLFEDVDAAESHEAEIALEARTLEGDRGMTLTVGQKLWYVPHSHQRAGGPSDGSEATIAVIEHGWVTFATHWHPRADKSDLYAYDGHYSPGRYYLSQDAHEKSVALNKLWNNFSAQINRMRVPDNITAADIRQAAELLGVTLP